MPSILIEIQIAHIYHCQQCNFDHTKKNPVPPPVSPPIREGSVSITDTEGPVSRIPYHVTANPAHNTPTRASQRLRRQHPTPSTLP